MDDYYMISSAQITPAHFNSKRLLSSLKVMITDSNVFTGRMTQQEHTEKVTDDNLVKNENHIFILCTILHWL